MAEVYADLIRKGALNKKTGLPYCVEDVPEELIEEVEVILSKEGVI